MRWQGQIVGGFMEGRVTTSVWRKMVWAAYWNAWITLKARIETKMSYGVTLKKSRGEEKLTRIVGLDRSEKQSGVQSSVSFRTVYALFWHFLARSDWMRGILIFKSDRFKENRISLLFWMRQWETSTKVQALVMSSTLWGGLLGNGSLNPEDQGLMRRNGEESSEMMQMRVWWIEC